MVTDEERDPVKGRARPEVPPPAVSEAKARAGTGVQPDLVVRRVLER